MKAVENCENCGRTIGKLEQPHVWRKHVVCAECHVHLNAAAPASAAVRPSHAPPPLPPTPHFHARPSAPKRQGPPPVPVAVRPESAAPQAVPMLLCATCGHAYPFNDVVSDNGKVTCCNCALAAAAQKAQSAGRDHRNTLVKRVSIAAAAVVLLGAVSFGAYHLVRSVTDKPIVAVTGTTPRAGDAMAEEIMAGAGRGSSDVPPTTTRSVESPDDGNPSPAAALFPPAELSPSPSPSPAPAVSAIPATPPAEKPVAPREEPGSDLTARRGATATPDAAAPAPAPAPSPAPAPAPVLPPEGTAAWHVHKGRELLALAKYPAALEQFNAALKKDRNSADAWHGAGLANQNMGDRNAALERLEKAATLYDPPSRAAVYNCAVANLRENPMRAAKMVKEFLSREGAAPDEQMHTLMGRALFSVNRQGRLNKVWVEAQEFYFAYNEQLEATRTDGRKRWGGEWVTGRDATAKWDRYRSRQQAVETLRTAVDRATKAKKDAWDKLYDQRTGMRLIGDKEQREGQQRYEHAAKQEITLRQQLKTAETEFNSAEKPPFPQLVKFVPMDPPRPPSPGLTVPVATPVSAR